MITQAEVRATPTNPAFSRNSRGEETCLIYHPDSHQHYTCSLEFGHPGDHEAYGGHNVDNLSQFCVSWPRALYVIEEELP